MFTGTKKIRNTFYRLNLHPIQLISADPGRLGDAALEWGEYYQHDPQIMAGELTGGYTAPESEHHAVSPVYAITRCPMD